MTKVSTFEDYLEEPKAMSFEQMAKIHKDMVEEIGSDQEALEYYGDLLAVAARYANIRALWLTKSKAEKLEQDSGRTSSHDSVITNLNVMARLLKLQGKTSAWRDELGDEKDRYGRKRLGDFACYLAFVSEVNAR